MSKNNSVINTSMIPALTSLILASCGGIHSAFHKEPLQNDEQKLASVSIPMHKPIAAVTHSTGVVPMVGGFRAALFIEDPSIVQSNIVDSASGRKTTTMIEGLKLGSTKAYYTNVYYLLKDGSSPDADTLSMIRQGNYFELEVTE